MTAAAQRFIDLTPQGVLSCAGASAADLQGRLLQALLLRDPRHAWHSDELARLLPDAPRQAARALFALQREGCIDVQLEPPPAEPHHWAAIGADLQALVDEGATLAALLDHDGFVIAQAGAAAPADDALAVPPQAALQLHVGEGALRATYGLALLGLQAQGCRAVVQLVRRLARMRAAH